MPNPVTSGVSPVNVPNSSGFDKSHRNLLTAKVGTLVPVMCDPVIPGSRVSLRSAKKVTMPPLASDAFMNVEYREEAFFVPASSLYGGFNDFATKRRLPSGVQNTDVAPLSSTFKEMGIPELDLYNDTGMITPGSLLDYLGMNNLSQIPSGYQYRPLFNPLPLLAYHRVYDQFYRNSLVSAPLFSPMEEQERGQSGQVRIGALPWLRFQAGAGYLNSRKISSSTSIGNIGTSLPNDGSFLNSAQNALVGQGTAGSIYLLHQRHFGPDYFTTSTPTPQRGISGLESVTFTVDTTTGEGSIPISAIRTLNALSIFREKNNLIDDDIHAYNAAHFGVKTRGYGESVPRFLGSSATPVYSVGVDQMAGTPSGAATTQNPFNTIGAQYGRVDASGNDMLVEGFEAPEFGYILVLGSLVPKAAYSGGVNRHFLDFVNGGSSLDIPDADLQGLGPQEIYLYELYANILGAGSQSSPTAWKEIFGYQQRFAHYMECRDEIHGLFRDGQSLDAFALQRTFDATARISGTFLVIPPTFLDQVAAVSGQISQYGYMLDTYFDYKVTMPLAAYSVPTLENPAGHTEWQPKPGYKLR